MTYPLDEFAGTEPDEGPRRMRAALVLATAAVAAVAVGLVAVWALHDKPHRSASAGATGPPVISESSDPAVPIDESPEPSDSPTTAPTRSTGPTPRPTPRSSRTVAPQPPATQPPQPPPPVPKPTPPGGCTSGCVLAGDGTTRIGGVAPGSARAGTYHSDGPARGGSCTWSLSRDEAGDDQIAGKTVDRPTDVNVRDKTWFHSDNCAVWRLVGGG